jgi:Carboxypeptidase regulatory-like domain
MTNRRVAVLLSLVLLISLNGALAQTSSHSASTTTIKGTVLGADGKPVVAAAVECQSAAGLRPRVVHTDSKGHYAFTGLKQDAYDLRATSNGAYSDWEKNIPLRKGQTKEITLRLLNGNTTLSGLLPEQPKN